uniref:CAP family protein n=1 Tax=Peterkaempfera griseoplana TaxID=66896 RepID=UPI0006E30C13
MKKLGLLAAAAALVAVAGVPAPARPALPDTTDQQFLTEALRAVNAVRARHHAPPLTLDRRLSGWAAARAHDLSRQEGLHGVHGGAHPGTGENLYWGASSLPARRSAQDAVSSWYQEARNYDFAHPGGGRGTSRFTQLVWRASTRLGAARVSGRGAHWYETYIVFLFRGPGNIPGEYARNVRPAVPGPVRPGKGTAPRPGTGKPGAGVAGPGTGGARARLA